LIIDNSRISNLIITPNLCNVWHLANDTLTLQTTKRQKTMTKTFSPKSPVFIYPFQNQISDSKSEEIISKCRQFLDQWKSHGSDLLSDVWIEENQFLIVAVDTTLSEPSGCSKDKLYHFAESLKDLSDIQFGDIHKFWVKKEHKILNLTKKELKENLENKSLSFDNQLFPLWISDFGQYTNLWAAPLLSFKAILKLEEKKSIFQG